MQLSPIQMDPNVARKAFLEYRDAVRDRHNAEDEQLMRAYRELAKGTQIIKLPDVIRAGGTTTLTVRDRFQGTFDVTLPRLAVTRAHRTACWTFGIDGEGRLELRGKREMAASNRLDRVWLEGFEPGGRQLHGRSPRILAQAPVIPPPFRPAHKLEGYHLLWEAEWALTPVAPTDPALLKHIGGDLYAVVAVWDLTEIERAVLAGRPVE